MRVLITAGVSLCELANGPVQGRCGAYRDVLVVYGKEKVYGSIP